MRAWWNQTPLKYRWIMELWTVRDCSTYCWDPSDHSMNSLDTESLAEERRCLGAVFSPEHESGAPTDTDGSTRVSHSFSSQPALHHALTHSHHLTKHLIAAWSRLTFQRQNKLKFRLKQIMKGWLNTQCSTQTFETDELTTLILSLTFCLKAVGTEGAGNGCLVLRMNPDSWQW